MNKPESKIVLSQQGKARKQAMLGQLQEGLVSIHRKRRLRTAIARGAALAGIVAIAGLTWSFLVPASESENRIADRTTKTAERQLSPMVASVGNVTGIIDKYVVANTDDSAKFETMADDELLSILAAAGQPSALGKINGKVRVIGNTVPVRKQGHPL